MKKLRFYFYALAAMGILSCSSEEVKGESGTEVDNLVAANFLSTIETWRIGAPRTSVEWSHETNSDGKLVKSTLFEKHPRRVLSEMEYLEFNEEGLPTEYDQVSYSFGEQDDSATWQVSYNENGTITGMTTLTHEWSFSQLDDKKRVKSDLRFDDNGEFVYRVVFDYDENDNPKASTRYSTESGNDDSDIIGKWDYTFTHFGDWKSAFYLDGETGSTTEWTYSYGEDYTLESAHIVVVHEGYTDNYRREYNEEEKMVNQSITRGDSRWEEYYSNGNLEVVEYYHQDILWDVQIFAEDGSKEWKIMNRDDGSYRVEYYNAEDELYKVEYYDAEDNLLTTENYSDNKSSKKLQRRTENIHFSSPLPSSEIRK